MSATTKHERTPCACRDFGCGEGWCHNLQGRADAERVVEEHGIKAAYCEGCARNAEKER